MAGFDTLTAQQQRFVTGVELHLAHGAVVGVEPAGVHEPQGRIDAARQHLIALAGGAGGHELLIPVVHLPQVGVAAPCERSQQVERRRGGAVCLQQAGRVGRAGLRFERDVVDNVAAEDGQRQAVTGLGGRAARLGELTGDSAHLDDGQPGGVLHHHGHLQDHLEAVADLICGRKLERLGAVAGLQYKCLAGADVPEQLSQPPGLACKNQRRTPTQLGQRCCQSVSVGPVRLLAGGPFGPRAGMPVWSVLPRSGGAGRAG